MCGRGTVGSLAHRPKDSDSRRVTSIFTIRAERDEEEGGGGERRRERTIRVWRMTRVTMMKSRDIIVLHPPS